MMSNRPFMRAIRSLASVPAAYVNRNVIDYAPCGMQVSDRRAVARGFFAGVAFLTLVPMVGLPLVFGLKDGPVGPPPLRVMLIIMAITGSVHVGASAFFYFDRDFKPVVWQNRLRCLWSLALLPVGLLALGVSGAALAGPSVLFLVFLFQTSWLFYHYQRQNFGLISLVSTNVGAGPLPRDVGLVLNMVALAGIIGVIGTLPLFPGQSAHMVSPGLHAQLQWCGVGIYVLSFGFLIRAFSLHPHLRQDPWLAGAFLLGWAFFLPAVVFNMTAAAFLPLAVAHGAQYIMMMTVLSGRSSRGWLGVAVMGVLAAGVGFTLDSMKELPALLAATGFVQVHFLIDAKVWRLREPQQRAIMNRRFDFLLAR